MARRIVLAFLVLTVVILAATMVPLGVVTMWQYRRDFTAASIAKARTVASVLEEHVADHEPGPSLHDQLTRLRSGGEGLQLLSASGTRLAGVGPQTSPPRQLLTAARPRATTVRLAGGTAVVAAAPVGDANHRVGEVIVLRSTQPLQAKIHTLWAVLAAAGTGAALAAAGLAIWLSRWISRPLQLLQTAVRSVGGGNLHDRVDPTAGPPEVRRLAAGFNTMAGRLETLIEGHRAVAADVSHQLRTPLAALRLRLELMQNRPAAPTADLDEALAEIGRLSRLVDGLLAVARAEATTAVRQPLDLHDVVAQRLHTWQPLADENGISLRLDGPGPALAWAVQDHLDQILDNLLSNCFDLDPAPKNVWIDLACTCDHVTITVCDDGPGMSPAQRDQALRRFVTARGDSGGTGLGLAIVHRLVTAGGGTLELGSGPSGGLSVAFTVPSAAHTPAHPAWHGCTHPETDALSADKA